MGMEQNEAATQVEQAHESLDQGVDSLLSGLAAGQPDEGAETLPEGEQEAEATATEAEEAESTEGAETLPEGEESEDGEGEGEGEEIQHGQTEGGDTVTLADLAAELDVDLADLNGVEIPIKIDGQEQTATLGDLIKGHQLEGATRAKMEQAAGLSKEAEVARTAYKQALDQRFQQVDQVLTTLGAQVQVIGNPLQGLDPEVDPGEYLRVKEQHENNQRLIQAALFEQQQLAEQHAQIQSAEYSEWVNAEAKRLPEMVPEWKDAQAMQSGKNAGAAMLRELGFGDDEIANLHDSRMWAVIHRAVNGDSVAKKAAATKREIKRGNLSKRIKGKGRGNAKSAKRSAAQRVAKASGLSESADALAGLMQAIEGGGD